MIDHGKNNLLGIGIDAVDYEAATEKIIGAAHNRLPFATTALAVHGVMTGALDRTHRYRLNRLDMVVPDGQPVRWGLQWLHKCRLPDRVYGPNLMLRVLERAAAEDLPVFLFGTDAQTLEALCDKLKQRYTNLKIAGTLPSRFRQLTAAEQTELVTTIRDSGAKITMVGIGCPRQEVWAYEFRELLSMPILAVGAAFAFHAGQLDQAPRWMQDRGLEWFYRLVKEPKRLWRRYLYLNPYYLTLLFAQWTGIAQFRTEQDPPPRQPMLYG